MVLVFIITEFFSKHYVYILSMLYFRLDFRNGIAGPKYINFKNCNILQNYKAIILCTFLQNGSVHFPTSVPYWIFSGCFFFFNFCKSDW